MVSWQLYTKPRINSEANNLVVDQDLSLLYSIETAQEASMDELNPELLARFRAL